MISSQPARVIVVGGGITGLSAAWQCTRRGARVCLLERDDRFGGKIHTVTDHGFLIETGPDSFIDRNPALIELATELGMADQVIAVRTGRRVNLLSRGRMQDMPAGMGMVLPTRIGPFVTTRILTWRQKLRAACDLVVPRMLIPGRDESIGVFLRRRLGDGIVDGYAEVMVGGIYGAGVDELSLDAVLPSLRRNEEEYRSLLLASLSAGRAAARRTSPAGPPFHSLARGLGSLIDELTARLEQAGVEMRLGTPVDRIGSCWIEAAGERIEADAIVLACDPGATARLLQPGMPDLAAVLDEIPLGSTTVVTLGYPTSAMEHPVNAQGWLVCDRGPISGVTLSSAKFDDRAPAGHFLVRVFIPAKRGPLVDAPDEVVLREVTAHLTKYLGVQGNPLITRIDRWQKVMPKYTVGHLERVARIDGELERLCPQVVVAGSALHGVGVPDCVADGRRAANRVLDTIGVMGNATAGPPKKDEPADQARVI